MAQDPARLVVLLSGRGSNFLALQQAAEEGWLGGQIAAVLSDRPDAAGLERAAAAGLDTLCVDRSRFPDRASFEHSLSVAISGFAPRLIVLAGFMRVLSADFVQAHEGQIINIHPSLLPRHRGLHTHQRVLDAGELEHGASVHLVTADLDAGPVISQVKIEVHPEDTADTLAERLLPLEHRLYPATLALLLRQPVTWSHDPIEIEGKPLVRPLRLDRDLGADGRLLRHGSG